MAGYSRIKDGIRQQPGMYTLKLAGRLGCLVVIYRGQGMP